MGVEISGLAGLVAVALPLAALATVVLLALRDHWRRGREERRAPPASVDPPVAAARPSPAATPAKAPPAVSLDAGPPLDARLAAARTFIASGKTAEGADALRACLWEAGRQSRKDIQAEARVELGDLCLKSGDPITACEHWQIARGYFGELRRAHDIAAVEARMRKTGCPTDWVLNDF